MTPAFGTAILSAIFYGVATALQARGARTRSLAPFAAGVLLDLAGFAAQLVALRDLPLFVVQAAQAGNLAVTALACIPILGIRLGPRHWAAVLAVCAGLALLGASSGSEGSDGASLRIRFTLLATALVLGAAALLATRLNPIVQGVVAGLGFGLTALAIRAMPSLTLTAVIRDPAAYAAAAAGACAFLSFAAGLPRGAVTTVSALVILGETALPAAAGIALWHDHTRPGWIPAALLGFLLAVAGALTLARFAEPAPPKLPTEQP
jgi:drug/metabolite transporter (DMT)-like permease